MVPPIFEPLTAPYHKSKEVFYRKGDKSARLGTKLDGLFYQNDVESLQAIEKRIQGFKTQDVLEAVKTRLIEREENDERLAVYGSGNYVLAPAYRKFKVKAATWHSWTTVRREEL